jgi:hypothetical protein
VVAALLAAEKKVALLVDQDLAMTSLCGDIM